MLRRVEKKALPWPRRWRSAIAREMGTMKKPKVYCACTSHEAVVYLDELYIYYYSDTEYFPANMMNRS